LAVHFLQKHRFNRVFKFFFEFIDWWAAVLLGGDADANLSTQGDIWDTQWDMFLALCGAIIAQLTLARVPDQQLGDQLAEICGNASRRISRASRCHGLFELRPKSRSGKGRAFYCYLTGKRVVILHAFIKKSQQTPNSDLKIAGKRQKAVQHD